jgi:hypothetical protein
MVLTGAVRSERDTGHTRRRVIGTAAAGLGALGLAGCGLLGDDDPEPPEVPDPLEPLLTEALALAAAYDRAVASQPGLRTRLAPLAEDHRTHAAELSRLIGKPLTSTAPSASAVAADPAATVALLRQAEQAAQKTAVAACKAAAPDRAGLTGSIAACRATHAEALR